MWNQFREENKQAHFRDGTPLLLGEFTSGPSITEKTMFAPMHHRGPNDQPRAGWFQDNSSMIWGGAVVIAIGLGLLAYNYRSNHAVKPAEMQPITSTIPPTETQGQSSPQGPTGPLNTTTGGAPAANPQGETPARMQVVP